ncbi:MAG: TrkH family potassium uptake protein [Elainellaceae cyanobacterium]
MTFQIRAIGRDIGTLLLIPAGMALLSLPVCIISRDWFAIMPFLATVLVAGGLSLLLYSSGQSSSKDTSLHQTLISVALGWAIIASIGALPLWLTAQAMGVDAPPTVDNFSNGLNALFEGFSGFTSAGLTMTLRPSELPHSLQWWRSLMQWVGGVGVIVLAVALMEPSQEQYVLYQAEGRQSRLRLTMTGTVRRIWFIYTGYTALSVLLFRAVGMTWWAALNHSMSAISTGGFSVTDGSMGAYGAAAQLAVILVMICGAISFSVHDQLISKRRLSALWQERQHFFLLLLLVIGTGIVALDQYRFVGQFSWVGSAFQWVSALTTCGFSTQPLQFWSSTSKILLSIAMTFGGAAGSTVGGLKLNRVLALIEAIAWRFRRTTLSPRQITLREINGQLLNPAQASRRIEDAVALALLWLVVVTAGVLVLIPLVPGEYGLSDVLFESSSALGAAGISVGITGPSLQWGGKCALIVLMWMGRLEIIPVLMLFYVPWHYITRRSR